MIVTLRRSVFYAKSDLIAPHLAGPRGRYVLSAAHCRRAESAGLFAVILHELEVVPATAVDGPARAFVIVMGTVGTGSWSRRGSGRLWRGGGRLRALIAGLFAVIIHEIVPFAVFLAVPCIDPSKAGGCVVGVIDTVRIYRIYNRVARSTRFLALLHHQAHKDTGVAVVQPPIQLAVRCTVNIPAALVRT